MRQGGGAVEYGNGPPAVDDDDNDEILALIPVVSQSFWMPIVWLHCICCFEYLYIYVVRYLCVKVCVCEYIYGFNALQVDFRCFFPVITYTFHNHESGT